MATTIQISEELRNKLNSLKFFRRETYEDIIWDLVENGSELSEQTKKDIKQARADVKAGNVYTLEEVKKELGL